MTRGIPTVVSLLPRHSFADIPKDGSGRGLAVGAHIKEMRASVSISFAGEDRCWAIIPEKLETTRK